MEYVSLDVHDSVEIAGTASIFDTTLLRGVS